MDIDVVYAKRSTIGCPFDDKKLTLFNILQYTKNVLVTSAKINLISEKHIILFAFKNNG